MHDCLVIRTEQDVLRGPLRTPDERGDHYGEQFLIGDGRPSLARGPRTTKPFAPDISSEPEGACRVRGDLHIRRSCHTWKEPKAQAMP